MLATRNGHFERFRDNLCNKFLKIYSDSTQMFLDVTIYKIIKTGAKIQ